MRPRCTKCKELLKLIGSVSQASILAKTKDNSHIKARYAQTSKEAREEIDNCPTCFQNFEETTGPNIEPANPLGQLELTIVNKVLKEKWDDRIF